MKLRCTLGFLLYRSQPLQPQAAMAESARIVSLLKRQNTLIRYSKSDIQNHVHKTAKLQSESSIDERFLVLTMAIN